MSIGDALETATNVASNQKVEAARLGALREQVTALRIQRIRASPLMAYGQALAIVLTEMAESPRVSTVFGSHQPQVHCMSPAHFYLDSVDTRLIPLGLPDRQTVAGHHVHLDIKLKPGADIEVVSLWVEIYQVGETDTRVVRRRKTVASPADAAEFVEGIIANFVLKLEQAADAELDASMTPKPW